MRRPLIAGNWKMFKSHREALELTQQLLESVGGFADNEILICPPFVYLAEIGRLIEGSEIRLGAQNLYFEDEGAFTGEVSAPMLSSIGCDSVILGHSERRWVFGETDGEICRKVHAALKSGLRPILCVGEKIDERQAGKTLDVVLGQLRSGLEGVGAGDVEKVVIAYEPVWAIGTGQTATPEQGEEVHRAIREDMASRGVGETVRILYGGSVKPNNIKVLMAEPDIDGALVGGASLQSESFTTIVRGGEAD